MRAAETATILSACTVRGAVLVCVLLWAGKSFLDETNTKQLLYTRIFHVHLLRTFWSSEELVVGGSSAFDVHFKLA